MNCSQLFKNKRILITGAAGTVGRELTGQLMAFQPAELRLMDNNESEMFFLMEEHPGEDRGCYLGDVRDYDKLHKLAAGVDIIFHAAALKHVILSEYNPFDVVQTNIIGVENVVRAAKAQGVGQVIFTSSDKAVNPTNVMGTSKLMGERLMTAANLLAHDGECFFSSTRFGNVIGSRGSVVPLFLSQIRKGGPVTVTDRRMSRFVMSISEAARLVLESAARAKGGEVFITKMPVIKIIDLAEVMIELVAPKYGFDPAGIGIELIGSKPGEKLFEELMSEEEVNRAVELEDMFVVTPAFRSIYSQIDYTYPTASQPCGDSYVSSKEAPMTKDQLRQYLLDREVLDTMDGSLPREMV